MCSILFFVCCSSVFCAAFFVFVRLFATQCYPRARPISCLPSLPLSLFFSLSLSVLCASIMRHQLCAAFFFCHCLIAVFASHLLFMFALFVYRFCTTSIRCLRRAFLFFFTIYLLSLLGCSLSVLTHFLKCFTCGLFKLEWETIVYIYYYYPAVFFFCIYERFFLFLLLSLLCLTEHTSFCVVLVFFLGFLTHFRFRFECLGLRDHSYILLLLFFFFLRKNQHFCSCLSRQRLIICAPGWFLNVPFIFSMLKIISRILILMPPNDRAVAATFLGRFVQLHS